ncbi:hypothetical protein Tco_0895177 [Tanacetum coccineum]|uniref:Uncharacterized protein n=1 Tax=Tanacetum coccineum TaxID=301880 RepID=A0ABQ5CDT9_9ASTR
MPSTCPTLVHFVGFMYSKMGTHDEKRREELIVFITSRCCSKAGMNQWCFGLDKSDDGHCQLGGKLTELKMTIHALIWLSAPSNEE